MHLAKNLDVYRDQDINHQGKEFLAVNDAYLKHAKLAKKYKYNYSISGNVYGNCDIYEKFENVLCSSQVITDNNYLDKQNKILDQIKDSSLNTAKFFSQLSWILSLPHVIKSKVSFYLQDFGKLDEFIKEIYYYSQIQNLINYSNNESENKTFKFFYNSLVHSDWLINDNCEIVYEFFEEYQGAFNADYCVTRLLINFFDKLKDLNIYDQTKIIITSDHGHHKLKEPIRSKNFQTFVPKASALLLVKDFNNSGALKSSLRLMSNMDTYGLALSGVSEGKEIHLDKIKNSTDSRVLINTYRVSPIYTFDIYEAYRVKDNIYNENNWEN